VCYKMSTNFKIIILAAFDKNDFHNKALTDIHGKPMIQHVFESAKGSDATEIIIATDSTRIGMVAEDFGATVCMIVNEGLTGINRLQEVVDKMDWSDDTLVVQIPADAPLIPGSIITQAADNLMTQQEVECSILYSMKTREEAEKNYTVTMVTDNTDRVLYLSQLPLPYQSSVDYSSAIYKCQIDVNAYRCGLLQKVRNLPESELAMSEGIEELKLLFNGVSIHAAEAVDSIGERLIDEENIAKVKFLISPDR